MKTKLFKQLDKETQDRVVRANRYFFVDPKTDKKRFINQCWIHIDSSYIWGVIEHYNQFQIEIDVDPMGIDSEDLQISLKKEWDEDDEKFIELDPFEGWFEVAERFLLTSLYRKGADKRELKRYRKHKEFYDLQNAEFTSKDIKRYIRFLQKIIIQDFRVARKFASDYSFVRTMFYNSDVRFDEKGSCDVEGFNMPYFECDSITLTK